MLSRLRLPCNLAQISALLQTRLASPWGSFTQLYTSASNVAHQGPAVKQNTQETSHVPKEIKLVDSGKRLEVVFRDGHHISLTAEYLRVMSPSADTHRKDMHGRERVVSGRRYVRVLGVEPVGRYAIRLQFDDLHTAGIFSWDLLHDLGAHKWRHMRNYIARLKKLGLTREPSRTPGRTRTTQLANHGPE